MNMNCGIYVYILLYNTKRNDGFFVSRFIIFADCSLHGDRRFRNVRPFTLYIRDEVRDKIFVFSVYYIIYSSYKTILVDNNVFNEIIKGIIIVLTVFPFVVSSLVRRAICRRVGSQYIIVSSIVSL